MVVGGIEALKVFRLTGNVTLDQRGWKKVQRAAGPGGAEEPNSKYGDVISGLECEWERAQTCCEECLPTIFTRSCVFFQENSNVSSCRTAGSLPVGGGAP